MLTVMFTSLSGRCLPGVGDTGAHLSIIIDAGWPIFVLSHWHRERGFYSLEEAVHKITAAPAAAAAIHNRGELRVGMRADINLIDLDAVGELKPEMVQVRLPLELRSSLPRSRDFAADTMCTAGAGFARGRQAADAAERGHRGDPGERPRDRAGRGADGRAVGPRAAAVRGREHSPTSRRGALVNSIALDISIPIGVHLP